MAPPGFSQIKGQDRRDLCFLPAWSHSCQHGRPSCHCYNPSLILKPNSSGFRHRPKSHVSLGILQICSVKLYKLLYLFLCKNNLSTKQVYLVPFRMGKCGRVHGVMGMGLERPDLGRPGTREPASRSLSSLPLLYLLIHPGSYPIDDAAHIKEVSFLQSYTSLEKPSETHPLLASSMT